MHWTIRLIISTPVIVWQWALILQGRYGPIPPSELAVASAITVGLLVWVFNEFVVRRED